MDFEYSTRPTKSEIERRLPVERLQLEPSEFQNMQRDLQHAILLDVTPVGCRYDEVLVEILSVLGMSVVLDRTTSSSRTTWLAGMISNTPMLLVIDALSQFGRDYASVDVWFVVKDFDVSLMNILMTTKIAEVALNASAFDVTWHVDHTQASSQMVVTLVSRLESERLPIFFTLNLNGIVSERFSTILTESKKRVSFAVDITNKYISRPPEWGSPYLTLSVSDASWKPESTALRLTLTWTDSLIRVLKRKAVKEERFTDFSEVTREMNLSPEEGPAMIRDLFVSMCLDRVVHGCGSQRISDHCKRAVILTGLVICFSPPRGLTGYLDLLGMEAQIEHLSSLGSPRTWRSHLSDIVHATEDFIPQQVALTSRRKDQGPGRPPIQLVPTSTLSDLLETYLNRPDEFVCQQCRFGISN